MRGNSSRAFVVYPRRDEREHNRPAHLALTLALSGSTESCALSPVLCALFRREPMFEDSTFASASRIHTRSPRYAAGSMVLQTALLAVLLLSPTSTPAPFPANSSPSP